MKIFNSLHPAAYEKAQEEWRPAGILPKHLPMLERAKVFCKNKQVELNKGFSQDQFFNFLDEVAPTKVLSCEYTSGGQNYSV
ncbi:MAG: hypothetical protein IPJ51_10735 [Saprospiraceae bacterium]|nr:hypothetical protein [Saprospiraceae bacterium]